MTKKKVVYFLMQVPIIFDILRTYIFFRHLVVDPKNIRQNHYWYKTIKKLRINKKNKIFLDRQNEIKEFFQLSNKDLFKLYTKKGLPNSLKFRKNLNSFFEETKHSDDLLKKSHKEASLFYSLRLMMHYTRFTMILPYMEHIINTRGRKIKVLDYGCGVSDIGLLFAYLGGSVTIADLDNKKLDFAAWRFKKRNLNVKIIKIKDPSVYPKLPKNTYDLIIATEVMEHVRNPLTLLKNFSMSLKKGGFLFDSMGGTFDRDTKGDHLIESINIGNSKEYIDFYKSKFKQIILKNKHNCLFEKK